MQMFYVTAVVLTTLSLVVAHSNQTFAASPNAAQVQEKTVPQGKDPPGNDSEDQSNSTTKHKGVIKLPQTGDEGIYTQAPNPNAGTNEEVIPPPGSPSRPR
jgi:hypothetical protein